MCVTVSLCALCPPSTSTPSPITLLIVRHQRPALCPTMPLWLPSNQAPDKHTGKGQFLRRPVLTLPLRWVNTSISPRGSTKMHCSSPGELTVTGIVQQCGLHYVNTLPVHTLLGLLCAGLITRTNDMTEILSRCVC